MLLKCCSFVLAGASLLLAQHGGGGHGSSSGGGGFHGPSAGRSGFNSGYTTGITPQSYSGHLTFSTPGMGTTGLSGVSAGAFRNGGVRPPLFGTGARPVGVRPENRRMGRYGYYGLGGWYPVFGYGYYGDDYSTPYYSAALEQQPQYIPYETGPDPNAQYPPIPYAVAPAVSTTPDPPSTPITIVLKSGQKLEVQNYAIMNGVFWDFTKQNSKRIPLAEIDSAASAKATDAAGGAFPEESFATSPK